MLFLSFLHSLQSYNTCISTHTATEHGRAGVSCMALYMQASVNPKISSGKKLWAQFFLQHYARKSERYRFNLHPSPPSPGLVRTGTWPPISLASPASGLKHEWLSLFLPGHNFETYGLTCLCMLCSYLDTYASTLCVEQDHQLCISAR